MHTVSVVTLRVITLTTQKFQCAATMVLLMKVSVIWNQHLVIVAEQLQLRTGTNARVSQNSLICTTKKANCQPRTLKLRITVILTLRIRYCENWIKFEKKKPQINRRTYHLSALFPYFIYKFNEILAFPVWYF